VRGKKFLDLASKPIVSVAKSIQQRAKSIPWRSDSFEEDRLDTLPWYVIMLRHACDP